MASEDALSPATQSAGKFTFQRSSRAPTPDDLDEQKFKDALTVRKRRRVQGRASTCRSPHQASTSLSMRSLRLMAPLTKTVQRCCEPEKFVLE